MIGAGEMWGPVGAERDRWWAWVAPGGDTRQVAAMACGGRDERTARCLGDAPPAAYRDRATAATDLLAGHRAAVPGDRHAAAGEGAGLTAHVGRFFCALRRRCARFVRETLSFSERWGNHVGPSGTSSACTTYAARRATTNF